MSGISDSGEGWGSGLILSVRKHAFPTCCGVPYSPHIRLLAITLQTKRQKLVCSACANPSLSARFGGCFGRFFAQTGCNALPFQAVEICNRMYRRPAMMSALLTSRASQIPEELRYVNLPLISAPTTDYGPMDSHPRPRHWDAQVSRFFNFATIR